MTLTEHKQLLAFLEHYEALVKSFCDVSYGTFSSDAKKQARDYIERLVASEDGRLKLHQKEDLHKGLLSLHSSALELLK